MKFIIHVHCSSHVKQHVINLPEVHVLLFAVMIRVNAKLVMFERRTIIEHASNKLNAVCYVLYAIQSKIDNSIYLDQTTNSSACGDNEEYNHLATQCQPSCEQPDRLPCPRFGYAKGCVCQEGFYRATNNVTSPCILCPFEN